MSKNSKFLWERFWWEGVEVYQPSHPNAQLKEVVFHSSLWVVFNAFEVILKWFLCVAFNDFKIVLEWPFIQAYALLLMLLR